MALMPIVAGVDGSEESLRAVEWAALEAQRHRAVGPNRPAPTPLSARSSTRCSAMPGVPSRSSRPGSDAPGSDKGCIGQSGVPVATGPPIAGPALTAPGP